MSNMHEGRYVFVTGGSGGVGQAMVKIFAREGAKVLFSYNSQEEPAKLLEKEISDSGGWAKAFPLDVRSGKQCRELAEKFEKEGWLVDVLVNNAAVTEIMPFALLEEEDWDKIMEVNVKGPFLVTKAFIRGMIRRKKGSIVNLGSLAGHRLLEVPVHYATSKSAMLGFTLSLAREMGKFGIRVNCVVPGLLEGGVSAHVPEKQREEFCKYCASHRPGTLEEVAELAVFVASDRASYINAQSIFVDGGF
ncbi:MAG: SDR family oxidoreductase [Candidatus Riflebacteria bacterium]|nr:SDR family oxidoreductase [Candidatus Riflebacteria bacterium]